MTPGRTIRSLLSRLSAGEAINWDDLRAAGLVTSVEAVLDDWARRGLVARSQRCGAAPRYAITPLGAATEHWD